MASRRKLTCDTRSPPLRAWIVVRRVVSHTECVVRRREPVDRMPVVGVIVVVEQRRMKSLVVAVHLTRHEFLCFEKFDW